MAKHTVLPTQASDHAADQAHLPAQLPPVPPSHDVTLPEQAHDAVVDINPLGVAHLPGFFDLA
jgi:hypothetical protein